MSDYKNEYHPPAQSVTQRPVLLSVGVTSEKTTLQGLQHTTLSDLGVMGEGGKKSSWMRQGARPNLHNLLERCWRGGGGWGGWRGRNHCYFWSWQLCLRTSPGSKSLLTDGWLQVAVTCAVCAGREPSGSQALREGTSGCAVPVPSAESLVSAFPCTSPFDAAHGTGVQQAGWCLQLGTWVCPGLRLCVQLPVVQVCSGMNVCFTVLCPSLYFSHFWIALWFLTSLQHNGSLWIYSAINSPLPVPESTWHFLPQAEKDRYGAEIKPAKSCTMGPWKYLPRSIWDHTLEPSCFLPQV